MKNYKATVKGQSGQISYEVTKTMRGAESFGKKIAK